MINEIKKQLFENQDLKYQKFSSSLLPQTNNVLGVRLPILRKIAKEIFKKDHKLFLKENDNIFFELTMIEAMLIGLITTKESDFNLIENFIPKINNWSICDCFCSSLKIVKEFKNEFKIIIEKYIKSNKEFDLRFCFVILLNYYIDNDLDYVLEKIKEFNNDQYYAKMAVAWCLSICIIKNYKQSIEDIKKLKIHPWVLKKGITKAIESLRLTKEQKEELKVLRQSVS